MFLPFLQWEITSFTSILLSGGRTPSKRGQLLKGRICSSRSKSFPLRVDHFEKGGKMKMVELLPLKVCPFSLIYLRQYLPYVFHGGSLERINL